MIDTFPVKPSIFGYYITDQSLVALFVFPCQYHPLAYQFALLQYAFYLT
jgi:hypothetical protein